MQELGYCSGIENYSRYFDGRKSGKRPFCLIDYFQDNFLTIIDESHVTIPQVRAMYGGDRSRKENLVDYGFRLPAALDNRPLKFEEFESLQKNIIFVSATPASNIIRERIVNNYDLYKYRKDVDKLYFYGAGCGTKPPRDLIQKVFEEVFINTTRCDQT